MVLPRYDSNDLASGMVKWLSSWSFRFSTFGFEGVSQKTAAPFMRYEVYVREAFALDT